MKNFQFKQIVDLTNINDSMELDSDTTMAYIKGELQDGTDFGVFLEVQGHVKVFYNDELYTYASGMPKELIDLFHKGGYSPNQENLCVSENNWFEIFIEEDGQMVSSDVCDAGGMNDIEILDLLVSTYREWRDELKDNETDDRSEVPLDYGKHFE